MVFDFWVTPWYLFVAEVVEVLAELLLIVVEQIPLSRYEHEVDEHHIYEETSRGLVEDIEVLWQLGGFG